jgi:hypothetical protein
MKSNKVTHADNQQERLKIESWIVGFTDGEGCFSVSIMKNKTSKGGWQIFPEFVVTQGKKSLSALEIFKTYFKCGKIFPNKRYDNHREDLYRYCVRSVYELEERVVPFFKRNQLKTYKQNDFEIFSKIVKSMSERKHLTEEGFVEIAKLIETMNRKKKSKFLESSETKRQTL